MKHSFWIICFAALWLGLMTPLASAQEEHVKPRETVARTDPNSSHNKPVNLAAVTVATPPAPLEERFATLVRAANCDV